MRSKALLRVTLPTLGLLAFPNLSWTHVTLRPSQALRPGGFGDVVMNVPSERASDTVSVSLEVPDAFLKAGGRLSRIEYPPGWQVVIDKEDKPDEVYSQEMGERAKGSPASEGSSATATSLAGGNENEVLAEMRTKWIKKVTFKGGSIPPDGFKEFLLSFQLPKTAGAYRFPAVQLYADGTEVAWTELVDGAQHPAPSIVLDNRQEQGDSQRMSLILSALALLIAVGLAVDRFWRKKSGNTNVASEQKAAV